MRVIVSNEILVERRVNEADDRVAAREGDVVDWAGSWPRRSASGSTIKR
jgi:hypothetical protein